MYCSAALVRNTTGTTVYGRVLYIQLCPQVYSLSEVLALVPQVRPQFICPGGKVLYYFRLLHAGITGSPDMTPKVFKELRHSGKKKVGSLIQMGV